MISPSHRSEVEPFHAMDVLAEANRLKAAGRPVISLAVGQPSFPAPDAALEAAREALAHGHVGYTDAFGLASLKSAIAADYQSRIGVSVDPARIAVTTGSSAGFNLAFLALFDPGDAVAIAKPGYPAYRNILKALNLIPVEVAADAASGFTLSPEGLEAAERAHGVTIRGVLLASPANPTGTVTGRAALKAIADWCDARNAAFISDEIYHGLVFSGEETSALSVTDNAVIINSFSKYYCMTGWRVGWMVLPEMMVRPIEQIAQSLYISAPELSQVAAEAALGARAQLDVYRDRYRANRDFLLKALPDIGLPVVSPMDGAFYAYVDCSRYSNDSMALARQILAGADVAVTPGADFDPEEGARFLRLSYAGTYDEIVEAVGRLGNWLKV
ncbi:aminotransferase class I/II-fold pyridoxal phosphate-dependent enzyme [Martelella alba]|uniref:aspartate transaminase n=1 Tax=Martelella alba TaxID=2590451 RepID=A0A506UK46_9HYPH|nr:aminotransferase class I/II-fold pyridoxal phosphate-dependent enzyme [Martelella alba]TPW33612.1 aminotransferase class I/II-fold pyridoxal phosphate-dependent enzyme [Martelella alba]